MPVAGAAAYLIECVAQIAAVDERSIAREEGDGSRPTPFHSWLECWKCWFIANTSCRYSTAHMKTSAMMSNGTLN